MNKREKCRTVLFRELVLHICSQYIISEGLSLHFFKSQSVSLQNGNNTRMYWKTAKFKVSVSKIEGQ